MNCREVQEHLSAFHDDELSEAVTAQVAAHVNSCQDCAEQLRVFRELTRLTGSLHTPIASNSWATLSAELEHSSPPSGASSRLRRPNARWAAAAALVLLSGAVALVLAFQSYHTHNLAEAFDHFLTEFSKSPRQAENVLSTMYEGKRVSSTEAERLLKYRPAVYRGLPADYSLNSAYVIKMPCCACFQANLASADGGGITVFEHDGEQNDWFGDRPSTEVICHGLPTHVVQVDTYLAASCRCGSRYLTIVGARDVAEVEQLLAFWLPSNGP